MGFFSFGDSRPIANTFQQQMCLEDAYHLPREQLLLHYEITLTSEKSTCYFQLMIFLMSSNVFKFCTLPS